MVTRNDLEDWMMENEEDVVLDGPYTFSTSQMAEFGKKFFDKMNAKMGTCFSPAQDWIYDLPEEWSVFHGDVGFDDLLDTMAEIINKYNVPAI